MVSNWASFGFQLGVFYRSIGRLLPPNWASFTSALIINVLQRYLVGSQAHVSTA